jgi:simple sugar transport system ATP-binding protein
MSEAGARGIARGPARPRLRDHGFRHAPLGAFAMSESRATRSPAVDALATVVSAPHACWMAPVELRLNGLCKRFRDVVAVHDASLVIRGGEVLALLGENGAGKSTLMRLAYGMVRPDAGHIEIDARRVRFDAPRDAVAAGIGMVFQQFSLIDALSVRENLALAWPRAPWWLGRDARRPGALDAHLARLVPGVDPRARTGDLAVGVRQQIEIAKVLLREARCVILDEPTAVLTPAEAGALHARVRALARDGFAVVLITHKTADVRACADRVAVMRAGRVVGEAPAADAADARIVEWMVGVAPAPAAARPARAADTPVRLSVRGLCAGPVRDVALDVHAGEIVAVAGVSGSGQVALAEALTGLRPLDAGQVTLDGQALRAPGRPARPVAALAAIPADPRRTAIAPSRSLAVNLALKRLAVQPWRVRRAALEEQARAPIARFDVRPPDPRRPAGTLSGGNLQKLVIARELQGDPTAVVACYPTMGLDVVATAQVRDAMLTLAANGCAVLWFGEDLDDLLAHAHRIVVMFDGRLVADLDAHTATPQQVGVWMSGHAIAPDPLRQAA